MADVIANFTRDEFRCRCGQCTRGYADMHPDHLALLEEARRLAGIPFVVTSAVRCPEWNRKVGGVDSSSHIAGYATDVAANAGPQRFRIIDAAMEAGFDRIGVAANFIHLDNDPSKPAGVVWTY